MSLGSENGGVPAVMNVTPTGSAYNNGGCGGWGGDWMAFIVLFLLFGMFGWGGMGGFGMGGFGGFGGGYPVESILQRSLDTQTIIGKLDGVNQGLCDGFYAQSNALNGLGMNVMQGFNGIGNAICNSEYQNAQLINGVNTNMMQGFNAANVVALQNQNALQSQLAQCCCGNEKGQMMIQNAMERGFCQSNYNDQANTNAIIQSGHNDTDRLLARLDAMENARKDERIAELQAQVNSLNLSASQAQQNNAIGAMISASEATILRRTGAECPTPAYVVQPPTPVNFPTNCCGQFTGWNNGCGGCGC